jgi:Catalytic LigB subunit of aromatic ring-opening dioxygenase
MAKLILGMGTSHGPQLGLPAEKWHLLREKDETDPRMNFKELASHAKKGIEKEITEEKWKARYAECMEALLQLRQILTKLSPDALIVVGDDQHENLLDDNMPVFCVYRGHSVPIVKRDLSKRPAWVQVEEEHRALPLDDFKCYPGLADHLIQSLVKDGFDVATSNKLRADVGFGHAFRNIYHQIMPDGRVPIVPLMVNTFYPPNQPTPGRCYELGGALKRAIEDWDANKTVAIVASGGLSHVIIDEELDRVTLDVLRRGDKEGLCGLPVEKLVHGSSEIRNWIVLGGAVRDFEMSLVNYVPCYRSAAGTGCAMAFAYWC